MERNRRNQKKKLSFEEYCALIEELLKLTDRKIKARPKLNKKTFIL